MDLTFECTGSSDMIPESWTGNIRLINYAVPYEMEVTALGSCFHILIGKYRYGNFICIPNWGIGTELSGLGDSFWNYENLSNTYPELSPADISSIVSALAVVERYIDF